MKFLAFALVAFSAPVWAQINNPVPFDATDLATKSDVAAVAATVPAPMLVAPPAEIVGGAAGAAGTYRTGTAVQPRITRTVPFTTGSAGTASVTWTDMIAVPLVFVIPNIASSATQVTNCFPVTGTITSTGATIKCMTTQTLLGLGLVPFVAATSGVVGQVLAIPAS